VCQAVVQSADLDLNAQFLMQFTSQAVLKTLVRFAFAAGELPAAAQVRVRAALSDQEFAFLEDQAGGNVDDSQRAQRPMLL